MPSFSLRPAVEPDFAAIRALIHRVRINPLGLDWRRFLVAVDGQGQVVGCGQIKPHRDGSLELASIAVEPEWQGQGVGRAIITELLAAQPGPLYLTCRRMLGPFYEKFGFRAVPGINLPPYFRRLRRLAQALSAIGLMGGEMLVMKREGNLHREER